MTKTLFRLLDTGLRPAAENMALDEVLLEEVAGGRSRPTLRFLRFSPPAALVGRHQDVSREVREDFCRSRGIEINRRLTGGGALYFQPSALGWELIGRPGSGPFGGTFAQMLQNICKAAAEGLNLLGLPARFRPRNDIEVEGRKISGTGGVFLTGGCLFQGTLLLENEIELFLKSLRVPVEKLKKREIESLLERVCFLDDLLSPRPSLAEIKAALVRAFAERFGLDFQPGGLTREEERRLARRREFFRSPAWVYGRRPGAKRGACFWSLSQTEASTFRVHLWVEGRSRRIAQALITGDFFCRPARFVLDLEAALKGVRAEAEALGAAVEAFYRENQGEFVGVSRAEVLEALVRAAARKDLVHLGLEAAEVNELFLVNLTPQDLDQGRLAWLLLPYCAKKTDCDFRRVPDCGRCGECEIGRMYELAQARSLVPYSVQSFEHLMEILGELGRDPGRYFVGSCCEAFYAKHQREMEQSGARGLLVNLDSTTCYDLGKGLEAYRGDFEHKTDLNCALIEKVVRAMNG